MFRECRTLKTVPVVSIDPRFLFDFYIGLLANISHDSSSCIR